MKNAQVIILQNWVNAVILIILIGVLNGKTNDSIKEISERPIYIEEYYVCNGDTVLWEIQVVDEIK